MSRFLALSALLLATACHSAGLYGHARTYEPLSDEATATASAKEYDQVMAQRQPDKWKNKPVKLFGVVVTRQEGPGGAADALARAVGEAMEKNTGWKVVVENVEGGGGLTMLTGLQAAAPLAAIAARRRASSSSLTASLMVR